MERSRLRNKILNTRSDLDRKAYNKQRNYVVSLLRKEKSNFTVILALTFRQKIELLENCKPFLTDKTNKTSTITLIEEVRVISQDHLIAKTFNEVFQLKICIKIKNKKALIHQKKTLFQVSLKNIKTTQVLSRLKLKTYPKLLDSGKLILMRSKSLSKN